MTRIEVLKKKIKYSEIELDSIDKFMSQGRNKSRKDKIAILISKQRRLLKELKVAYSLELLEHEANEIKYRRAEND
ncbi:MAG: hypothetical protein ACRCXV_00675 [Bacteroidales bacterium]